MRNPKFLKTGPEFYKTQIYLENYLLILTNIQTWVNYRLYSQDLANLVQENIGFNFKTVYQMFRFRTRFLPESRKSWRVFLIILCLILYGYLVDLSYFPPMFNIYHPSMELVDSFSIILQSLEGGSL